MLARLYSYYKNSAHGSLLIQHSSPDTNVYVTRRVFAASISTGALSVAYLHPVCARPFLI